MDGICDDDGKIDLEKIKNKVGVIVDKTYGARRDGKILDKKKIRFEE